MRELRWNPGEEYAGSDWDRADVTRAPAGTAHLEFLRRPAPFRRFATPGLAALDDSPLRNPASTLHASNHQSGDVVALQNEEEQ
jgi:hypothetical protein